jgi:hypothetical protein
MFSEWSEPSQPVKFSSLPGGKNGHTAGLTADERAFFFLGAAGVDANRKVVYIGLFLGKKSRLSGRILRVTKIAQADANQAKPLARAEADTF